MRQIFLTEKNFFFSKSIFLSASGDAKIKEQNDLSTKAIIAQIGKNEKYFCCGQKGGAIVLLNITLLTVGKLKEKFYLEAVKEYEKRLSAYCRLSIVELAEERLPENPSAGDISRALQKEAEEIFKNIPKGAWFCVFSPDGKVLSSEEFAEKLTEVKNAGKSSLCFLIGSSFGMAPEVKQKADFRLAMGKMTFPHHLFRVMALEQIYRAESICAGSRYHK